MGGPVVVGGMGAVFLHSGWRSGSTYLWNKFRLNDGCLGFYEPFNDLLANMTAVGLLLTSRHDADLRHPGLDRPYFQEYMPLLGDKGHPLFRDEFVCRNYFAADQDLPEQIAYVQSLLGLADKARRLAVLGLVRSLGRVGWFKRLFGGVNIVLIRSPFSQWVSGQRLATDRGYKFFDPMHFLILSQAPGGARAARHAQHYGIPRYERIPYNGARMMLAETVERAAPALRFEVFASVYFLSYMAALPQADLVLDIDRLSSDLGYRADMRGLIARATGCDLDFADVKSPRYRAPDAPPEVAGALRRISDAIASGADPLWDDGAAPGTPAAAAARATLAAKFADDCALIGS